MSHDYSAVADILLIFSSLVVLLRTIHEHIENLWSRLEGRKYRFILLALFIMWKRRTLSEKDAVKMLQPLHETLFEIPNVSYVHV